MQLEKAHVKMQRAYVQLRKQKSSHEVKALIVSAWQQLAESIAQDLHSYLQSTSAVHFAHMLRSLIDSAELTTIIGCLHQRLDPMHAK